jgi:hypothetical protein
MRFAARLLGLASGLALAVRPAGAVEAPGSTARRRRVPRSGMRSTVDAGGAAPDNARRSDPATVTLSGGDRRTWREGDGRAVFAGAVPGVTAGTACGRYRGSRARQPPRPQGFRPKDASEAAAPRRRVPRVNLSRLHPVTLAASVPSAVRACLRATTRPSGPARRRRALEAVEKAHYIRRMVALRENPGGAGLGGLRLLPRCGRGSYWAGRSRGGTVWAGCP